MIRSASSPNPNSIALIGDTIILYTIDYATFDSPTCAIAGSKVNPSRAFESPQSRQSVTQRFF